MTVASHSTPALEAAEKALNEIYVALDSGRSFRVEAGAGAGKTHSLVRALQHVVDKRGRELLRHRQQVACITYTNVASNEIVARTGGHPVIWSSTIHAFCWLLIRDFQVAMRSGLASLGTWKERLAEVAGGVGTRVIRYDLGHPRVKDNIISLGHNDVLAFATTFLAEPKFRRRLADRFPVLFIDEYQDTDARFADALRTHILDTGCSPLVGLFGDHWQKIYGNGCGALEHGSLLPVDQKSNFRSAQAIVNVLNHMRPELPQAVSDVAAVGTVVVYHTNGYAGERLSGAHWKGDMPAETAHAFLSLARDRLVADGWTFDPGTTKILMLTHNVLAKEQGYGGIAEALGDGDLFAQKQDPYVAFLVDVIEPMISAYEGKRFGDMLRLLGRTNHGLASHEDKKAWATYMDALLKLRSHGTIGAVIDHIKGVDLVTLSEDVERRETLLSKPTDKLDEREQRYVEQARLLREVPFAEIVPLARFIDEKTLFSTKHGVKGAGFENVLVVIGRGWNKYDFNALLEQAAGSVLTNKRESFERNRNLFYVACSRPKRRLALLFTQQLSPLALTTLSAWFGDANVKALTMS